MNSMNINPDYTLHQVADEHIILLQGDENNRVVSLNPTSVYLWEQLQDRTFTEKDVTELLTARFDVDEAQAARDARKWIRQLQDLGIIL